jgi:hypothetical protein
MIYTAQDIKKGNALDITITDMALVEKVWLSSN